MVNRYRSLDVMCTLHKCHTMQLDIPTWCPNRDTGAAATYNTNVDYFHKDICAAGHSLAKMQIVEDWGILQAKGYPIDKVTTLLDWSTSIIDLWHMDIARNHPSSKGSEPSLTLECFEKAFQEDPDQCGHSSLKSRRRASVSLSTEDLRSSQERVGKRRNIAPSGRLVAVCPSK